MRAPRASRGLARHRSLIDRLARLSSVEIATDIPDGAIQLVLDEATLILPLASLIDVDAETARLRKELGKRRGRGEEDRRHARQREVPRTARRKHVVEEQRERSRMPQAAMAKLRTLKRLEGAA